MKLFKTSVCVITLLAIITTTFTQNIRAIEKTDNTNEVQESENLDGWKEKDGFKYYQDSDGNFLKGFQTIENENYYFNDLGQLQKDWILVNDVYYYGDLETGILKNGLVSIEGKLYYFIENKALKTGLEEIDSDLYYFEDYQAINGFKKVDYNLYYFEDYKALNTENKEIDGKKYYFKDSVVVNVEPLVKDESETSSKVKAIKNGWNKKSNGNWEYYKNGKKVNGWMSIEGLQYYFENYEMVHDWYLDTKTQTWYFFNGGVMQRSDITINGITYKFDNDGIWRGYEPRWVWENENYYYKDQWNNNVTGWQSIDGLQYKFYDDGKMVRDWYLDTKTQTWYFFNGGVMQTTNLIINGSLNVFDNDGIWRGIKVTYGWKEVNGKFYYYDLKTGKMYIGWKVIDSINYYFDADGVMATGKTVISNVAYDFDSSGRLKLGWGIENGYRYYKDANGKLLKDWNYIMGIKYFFNDYGHLIGDGGSKKIIDVSEHNTVNWNTVYKEGNIDGAILRFGYGFGENQIDAKFTYNYDETKKLNIPIGIYFYSYGESVEEAKKEAQRVLKNLKDLGISPNDLDYPIYYDLEEYHNISKSTLTKMAVTFCDIIEDAGYQAGVYASTSYYNSYLDYDAIKKYSLWVAQYDYYCAYKNPHDGWQYTSTEKMPGIGNVDVSIWY